MSGLSDVRWYDADQCRPHLAHAPLDLDPMVLTTRMMQVCPVLSFAELHRQRLDAAANVRVLLHAQALRLQTDAGGERVCAVDVACTDGDRLSIEADTVCGPPRRGERKAPSCVRRRQVKRAGRHHDLVGRFFMEHWYLDIPLGGWDTGLDLALYDIDSQMPRPWKAQPYGHSSLLPRS